MKPLAYVTTPPASNAIFKQSPEDFCVFEVLGFSPDGEGEHAFLQIQKRNLNTQDLVDKIMSLAKVKQVDVGFSGMKDKLALTTQWISVNLQGLIEPDWSLLESEDITCLTVTRHKRKLKRGTHQANEFRIVLREIDGAFDDIESRLCMIQKQGVPNYFGVQRFGRNGANIVQAEKMLRGIIKVKSRAKRGIYLSALRSMLFNQVLSQRVEQGTWNKALPGELLVLDGTHSYFQYLDDELVDQRVIHGDVHPSGPLWGKVGNQKFDFSVAFFDLETSILKQYSQWCEGLEQAGLSYDRRALRLPVTGLEWNKLADDCLELRFSLPTGCFATAVLREVVNFKPLDSG